MLTNCKAGNNATEPRDVWHEPFVIGITVSLVCCLRFLGTRSGSKVKMERTLYFGYGSNLWREQMAMRCPTSQYLGVGRLQGYRWIINTRGYANVVVSSDDVHGPSSDEVYGLVYSLEPSDEHSLDRNEGVPFVYAKKLLPIDFWPSEKGSNPADVHGKAQTKQALIYIDQERTKDDQPKAEYVERMNRGIDDGLAHGIPRSYVDQVLRAFIPAQESKEVGELARRKAANFEKGE